MTGWLSSLEPWGATLLRLVLGAAMVYYGYGKVMPAYGLHGDVLAAMRHHAHFVETLGMPAWLGYVSALTEFVGGILLILGLLTRLMALLVAVNLMVALCAVTLHRGYQASEYVIALIAMAVMLVFTGGGAASVDRRFGLR